MLPRIVRPKRRGVTAPVVEGTVDVGGRRLGFAEFGDPSGRPVFWLHGTPGASRQLAPLAKAHAADHGLRLIGLERPGVGSSTSFRYERIVDFAQDVARAADALDIDRFGVVGLSGGGPYTLACAHELPDRVPAVGVLGGVAPSVGDEAAPGGITALARYASVLAGPLERPIERSLRAVLLGLAPAVDVLFLAVYAVMGPGDKRVLDMPGVKDMFIDDLLRGIQRGGVGAILQDVVLFGRDWGFEVRDITTPVYWWHGDADFIIPYAHATHVASLLPDCTFVEQPGESHLSGYLAADQVLESVSRHLEP